MWKYFSVAIRQLFGRICGPKVDHGFSFGHRNHGYRKPDRTLYSNFLTHILLYFMNLQNVLQVYTRREDRAPDCGPVPYPSILRLVVINYRLHIGSYFPSKKHQLLLQSDCRIYQREFLKY